MPLTSAFSAFFNAVADALFPVHPAEREALAIAEADLFRELPRAARAPIPEACSIFSYKDERVSHLVWSIKYKKSLRGSALAGHALFRILCSFQSAIPGNMRILIVPMPIAKARRRERGFNQCELILDEIEGLYVNATNKASSPSRAPITAIERRGAGMTDDTGINYNQSMIFVYDLLIRIRHTSRQTLKDRQERLASVQEIFAVNEKTIERFGSPAGGERLNDYFVVVIDDVITTGSTMKDAVHTLRRAGFKNAWGLSLAH